MDLAGEGVSVYAEAKGEYTKQLTQYMLPALQQYFLDMLEEAKRKETDSKRVLVTFQELMEAIPEWNVDKVQRETESLATSTGCDYLAELMTAVFIAHTKVLSAIRITSKQKKLQIAIPKLEHFLHRTLKECARQLWSNTYLFSWTVPTMERQKNLRQIEALLHDGILQSIRSMLPVKNILREYLHDDDEEDEEDDEVIDAPVGPKQDDTESLATAVTAPAAAASSRPSTPGHVVDASGVAETVIDVSGTVAPATAPPVFTGIDSTIEPPPDFMTGIEHDMYDDEEPEEDIKILDAPPEALDGFEDLEPPPPRAPTPTPPIPSSKKGDEDILDMDFEELS